MNPTIYLCFVPLLVYLITYNGRKKQRAAMIAWQNKNKGVSMSMIEIAKRFVDTECIVYMFDGNTVTGTVKEISDGALLIQKSGGSVEAVNLGYVTRIKEYPKNKKGKNKSVVLD